MKQNHNCLPAWTYAKSFIRFFTYQGDQIMIKSRLILCAQLDLSAHIWQLTWQTQHYDEMDWAH